jgi:hypothetical protein
MSRWTCPSGCRCCLFRLFHVELLDKDGKSSSGIPSIHAYLRSRWPLVSPGILPFLTPGETSKLSPIWVKFEKADFRSLDRRKKKSPF